jgi:hypothetical protein
MTGKPRLGAYVQIGGKPSTSRSHRSHCPHYRQSRASIIPWLVFPHCGKLAPLERILCERKAALGSGFHCCTICVPRREYNDGKWAFVLVRKMEEAVLVENVRSAQRCNWYADMEQGSGLRPIINSAMQELSNTRRAQIYSVC